MNVILLEPITNLGGLGEEVTVKPGFARNYLLREGKAVRATEANRERFEERRAELERAASERQSEAEARGRLLLDIADLTIVVRASEEGRLYGSVGTQEIASALSERGVEVHKSEVRMPEGVIRQIGEYEVAVQLHSGVSVDVGVAVAQE